MVKIMLVVIVIMVIIASVGLYLGSREGAPAPAPTPTPETPTPAPAPTPPETPTPEPADLEPLPTQQIGLTLPGVESGTYEIEFKCELEAGRKITGSVEWEEGFKTDWILKIRPSDYTGGPAIKVWNVDGLSHDFDYTAPIAGEYSLRIINQRDSNDHHGIMEITGSWVQTEY